MYLRIISEAVAQTDSRAKFLEGINSAGEVDETLSTINIDTVVNNVILTILSYAAVIALVAVVIGGIMYIISFGDESKTTRAKKIILYALFGLLVTGGAFAIVTTLRFIIT